MNNEEESRIAAEAAHARVRQQVEQARRSAQEAAQFADDIKLISFTATSGRRDISITSDAGGVITAVRLTEEARERGIADFEAELTRTIRAAQLGAAEALVEKMDETLGKGSSVTDAAREQLVSRFSEPTDGLSYR